MCDHGNADDHAHFIPRTSESGAQLLWPWAFPTFAPFAWDPSAWWPWAQSGVENGKTDEF